MRVALTVALMLALSAPATANCLARSQNAIALVQAANAYTIARYTWQGDPWYDQVLPQCAKTGLREFACNAAFNLTLRFAEDRALHEAPTGVVRAVCLANYAGALAFGIYVRHAIGVQIFGARR